MTIQQNISLKPYNTFGIQVYAEQFVVINYENELLEVLEKFSNQPKLVLGGGSNILFTKNVKGLVVKVNIHSLEVEEENENDIFIKVGAGIPWHSFVKYCVLNNYGGIENLAYIPGYVGAAPIQNIGAYGVEVKEVIQNVIAYDYLDKIWIKFSNSDCNFGYRDSIFKQKYKNRICIFYVVFRLYKNPKFNLKYESLRLQIESLDKKKYNHTKHS